MSIRISRTSRKLGAGLAAATLLGGVAAGCGSDSSTTANSATPAAASAQQQGANAQAGAPTGTPPTGAPPGGGQAVTGTTAAKVKAAALAKYPGTLERVEQLGDGSYVAHVIQSSGEIHVLVSKAFAVTGTQQRPTPPSGGTAPSTSSSGTASST